MSSPTQTQHPWRATVRTAFAALVGLLSLLPFIAAEAGISDVQIVGQVLAVAAAITRVLAMPGVNAWITAYIPWLAAQPVDRNEGLRDMADFDTEQPVDDPEILP